MRLPDPVELDSLDAHRLHDCDRREWHCDNWIRGARYRNRLERLIGLIQDLAPGRRCLEVGCAQATLSTLLAERGFEATALDLRLDFVRYARLKRTVGTMRYLVGSGDHLPFARMQFDVVIITELLEHVAWPERFLAAARDCLAPQGVVVISTPNGEHRWNGLPTFASIREARERIEDRQFGPDGADHLFLFTRSELLDLVEEAGFRPLHIESYDYDLTRRMAGRLWPLPVWQESLVWATRPVARMLILLDKLMRHLPLNHRALTQGLILIASLS